MGKVICKGGVAALDRDLAKYNVAALSDPLAAAEFFDVRIGDVPARPETLDHLKRALVQMCSRSRSSAIRSDMVAAMGDRPGPLYVTCLNEYALSTWDVGRASDVSESLRCAVESLRLLI